MKNLSRRFRFRLSNADAERLEWLQSMGAHRSRSAAAKNAVQLYTSALNAQAQGFRLWCEHKDSGFREPYTPSRSTRDAAEQRHSCGFLELRMAPQEAQHLDTLMHLCHAENASAAVRAALRFLEDVLRRRAAGKHLVAVSRSGESFPILPAGDCPPHEWNTPRDATQPEHTPFEADPREAGFSALLPSSLWDEVERLAAQEQCSPHLLVVDLVRQGVSDRRRDFTPGLHDVLARESEQAQPPDDSASERRQPAPSSQDADATCNGIPATLAPPSVREGWALVVAQNYDGVPTGQLVTPDTVIPLGDDDLRPHSE